MKQVLGRGIKTLLESPPKLPEGTREIDISDFIKDDTSKVQLDLLPADALFAVGEVLTFGAKKYTRRGKCNCALSASELDGSKRKAGLSAHSSTCNVHNEISGAGNWAKDVKWSRYQAALLRHYSAFAKGEDWDRESGLQHLAHLACCSLFLLSHQLRGTGVDDRAERQGRNTKS